MKQHFAALKITVICLGLLTGNLAHAQINPVIPRDPAIEKKIDKIISKMTLVEKVGQMTQLDINLLGMDMRAEMMKLIMLENGKGEISKI